VCFHVIPDVGDPPKHAVSVINKEIYLTLQSVRVSCNIRYPVPKYSGCDGSREFEVISSATV